VTRAVLFGRVFNIWSAWSITRDELKGPRPVPDKVVNPDASSSSRTDALERAIRYVHQSSYHLLPTRRRLSTRFRRQEEYRKRDRRLSVGRGTLFYVISMLAWG